MNTTLRQEIFAIGYSNAGEEYTTATIDFGGSGELGNAVYDENEIRDGAVSNARIDARGDSTNPGGLNYTFIVNNSQGGNDSGSITLSAADIGTPALYVGQRISIVSGLGVGQYGEITVDHLYSNYLLGQSIHSFSHFSISAFPYYFFYLKLFLHHLPFFINYLFLHWYF